MSNEDASSEGPTQVILVRQGDKHGNLWVELCSPIEIVEQTAPPFHIALKVQTHPGNGDASGVFFTLPRPEAYRVIDQLHAALQRLKDAGAPAVKRVTKVRAPLNGGVNTETGDMILLFQGNSGLEHQLELPFDQSGATQEILDRASKASAQWHDVNAQERPDGVTPMNLHPRETEYLMLGQDPSSGRPILVTRLVGGQQFSFMLDTKIVESLRTMSITKPTPSAKGGWAVVADDIEWFAREWCTLFVPPREEDIRRGSAALRRLLVEDALGNAWRHFGFERQPRLRGPNVRALLAHHNTPINRVVSLIAGGGTLNGLQMSLIGCARVDNPTTGISADADEGFAVTTFHVSRDARDGPSKEGLTDLVEEESYLSDYCQAIGAIRRGETLSRFNIIKYFANVVGGAHFDPEMARIKGDPTPYALLRELDQKVQADLMEGLHFELLSIGQAIGRSPDLRLLVERIRNATGERN